MTLSGSENCAITCQNVWQVFGEDNRQQLKQALNQTHNDAPAAARWLRVNHCVPAVQDVSLSIGSAELFVIMGLSGSGKSTLIRGMSGLIDVTAGSIEIDGENILSVSKQRMLELRREKLGMVFQHFGLFPHMTVLQNVSFPLKMKGQSKRTRTQRATEVIELVGLQGLENSYPRELSGGQRQRVGIARSLAVNPHIWFLDEPFSALDPLIRRQLQDEFLSIQKTLRKSIVFITHDIAEALKLADRIAILRDGQVVQVGTPAEILLQPIDSYVREFTQDVAKGRYAPVSSVMKTGEHIPDAMMSDPGIRTNMSLDAALACCVSLSEPVPVRDEQGNTVGAIYPRDLASALSVDSP